MMNRKKAERIQRKDKQRRKAVKGKIITHAQFKANKARVKEILPETPQIVDPVIQFKLDKERDEEIQRQKDKDIAAAIYHDWRQAFINRRKSPDQLPEAVNELAVELEARIVSPWKDWVIANLLNPIIVHLHDAAILQRFSVGVLIDCPGKTIKNGIESDCEWGGIARFHKHTWENKLAEFACPECGHLCKQENGDMILESEARAWHKQQKKGKL